MRSNSTNLDTGITIDSDIITIDSDIITIDADGDKAFTEGTFQCAAPYINDNGRPFVLFLVSGRVWLWDVVSQYIQQLTKDDVNPSILTQGWMCQAENYMVIQDGISKPFIYDGGSLRRAEPGEIQCGTVMRYVNGRIWYARPDGYSFRATDIVYGDGTRASVLKETENTFLNGGGDFSVPIDSGGITSMGVPAVLDNALGQGPLLVFTPKYIFSINAPVDRDVWQNLNYPIQAISQVGNGAMGDRSTISVNGDVFYRAQDGVRSFIVARRDFNSWGNTPISSEVKRVIDYDQTDLLKFGSAVMFDNRMLMTTQPLWSRYGVYHTGLVVLDVEPLANMRGKAPPAWDGVWTGLNIHQVLVSESTYGTRCFLFARDSENKLSIWEVRPDLIADYPLELTSEQVPINWELESRSYTFDGPFNKKRLSGGDIFVDDLQGEVAFDVDYKPDQYPAWVDWHGWSECATLTNCTETPCITINNRQPQYRTKMRFPTPADTCDSVLNAPYKDMFETQARIRVTGHCRIRNIRLHAQDVQERSVGECRTDSSCSSITVCDSALNHSSEG